MKKIKVLMFVDRVGRGGAQSFLFSICANIDKEKFEASLLCLDDGYDHSGYESEFEANGVKIHKLNGIWIKNFRDFSKYEKALNNFFSENKFDIVHINSGPKNYLVAKYAKRYGSKVIYHSHNTDYQATNPLKKIYGNLLKRSVKKYSDRYFACSDLAAVWMFGKKQYNKGNVTVINNALTLNKYRYLEEIRRSLRNQLSIPQDAFVLGHVGRFTTQKNHSFLIDIFADYNKRNTNSFLVLVGTGSLIEQCKQKTKDLSIEDKVVFVGEVSNAYEYYNVFDMFVMPSLYEGLPVVSVEAQMNGLPCLFSDTITRELKVLDNVYFLPINEGTDCWCEAINNNDGRVSVQEVKKQFTGTKFDITSEVNKLEALYLGLFEGNR